MVRGQGQPTSSGPPWGAPELPCCSGLSCEKAISFSVISGNALGTLSQHRACTYFHQHRADSEVQFSYENIKTRTAPCSLEHVLALRVDGYFTDRGDTRHDGSHGGWVGAQTESWPGCARTGEEKGFPGRTLPEMVHQLTGRAESGCPGVPTEEVTQPPS